MTTSTIVITLPREVLELLRKRTESEGSSIEELASDAVLKPVAAREEGSSEAIENYTNTWLASSRKLKMQSLGGCGRRLASSTETSTNIHKSC